MKEIDKIFEDWDEEEENNDRLYNLEVIDHYETPHGFAVFAHTSMKNNVVIKLKWDDTDNVLEILKIIVDGNYEILDKRNYTDNLYDEFGSYQIIRIYKNIDEFNKLYEKWII